MKPETVSQRWERFKEESGLNKKLETKRDLEIGAIAIMKRNNPPKSEYEQQKQKKNYLADKKRRVTNESKRKAKQRNRKPQGVSGVERKNRLSHLFR